MQIQSTFDNTVKLRINGKDYQNWLEVSITCTLQSLARSFKVSTTRRKLEENKAEQKSEGEKDDFTIGIHPEDKVELFIGKNKILTGYVSGRTVKYSATGITVEISGDSKTVDLQQCYMPRDKKLSYKKQTHFENLSAVCKLFGIKVIDEINLKGKYNCELIGTETVGKEIENYLKKYSLLLTDNENGDLVIVKAGSGGVAHDKLELGKNILDGTRKQDLSKRFKHYVTLGQATNPRSELPPSSNHITGNAEDPTMTRERWFVSQEKGNANNDILRTKAEAIMYESIGNSDVLTYTLPGWRQSNGELWKVNTFAYVKDDFVGENGDNRKIIQEVTYSLNQSGSTVQLSLCSDEKFQLFLKPKL